MTLLEFNKKFGTENQCYDWLVEKKWGIERIPICPHCNHIHKSNINIIKKGEEEIDICDVFLCGACSKRFTIMCNSIFEGNRIPFTKWFLAIYLHTAFKENLSNGKLARYIDVSERTARKILKKLKECNLFENEEKKELLKAKNEIENYFSKI